MTSACQETWSTPREWLITPVDISPDMHCKTPAVPLAEQ
jgi:hypothetical protein